MAKNKHNPKDVIQAKGIGKTTKGHLQGAWHTAAFIVKCKNNLKKHDLASLVKLADKVIQGETITQDDQIHASLSTLVSAAAFDKMPIAKNTPYRGEGHFGVNPEGTPCDMPHEEAVALMIVFGATVSGENQAINIQSLNRDEAVLTRLLSGEKIGSHNISDIVNDFTQPA